MAKKLAPVTVSEELQQRLAARSQETGVPQAEFVRRAVESAMETRRQVPLDASTVRYLRDLKAIGVDAHSEYWLKFVDGGWRVTTQQEVESLRTQPFDIHILRRTDTECTTIGKILYEMAVYGIDHNDMLNAIVDSYNQ